MTLDLLKLAGIETLLAYLYHLAAEWRNWQTLWT